MIFITPLIPTLHPTQFLMVPRVRIELTTRGSSGPCSTTELPRHSVKATPYQTRSASLAELGGR
jgi:hypothetical protein